MCNLYFVGHAPLTLTKPFSNFLLLPGFTILCTVTMIFVLHQAKGQEKSLQWLEKAINKIWKGSSIKYVCNCLGMTGSSKMSTAAYRGRECQASHVCISFHFLAGFLSYSVLFYLQKFNLTFSEKRCVR